MSNLKYAKIGNKVWIDSLNKYGIIRYIDWDARYGSQYLIAVNEPETIEDTHPYENMWIKSKNLTLFANTTAIRK